MIIKSKGWKHAGFQRLASYIFLGAKKEGQETPEHSSLIWHNVREGSLPENVARDMYDWHEKREYKGKNYKALNHTILSWSPDEDKGILTDEVMAHLAQQYIQERCPDARVFGGIHKEDGKHYHVHLLFCNTLGNGDSMRMNKKEFAECKERLYAYQREHFPELKHSYETEGFLDKKMNGEYDGSTTRDTRPIYEMDKRQEGYMYENRKTLSEIIEQDHSNALHFLRMCRANGYEEYSREKEGLYGFKINGKKKAYSSIFLSKDQRKKFKQYRRQLQKMDLDTMIADDEASFNQENDIDEIGFEWEFD